MYTLNKSLGQHFLHDENVCKKIVASVILGENKNLLEVGPGGGAISKYLIKLPEVNYKAVEIDQEKVQYLEKTFEELKGKIILEDILRAKAPFEDKFNVVGNFPYNISSPIMFKILEWGDQVGEVIGMFQKEVAQRIAAKHGSKTYGILSVLMQTYYSVEYLFEVHENCFTPPPKVKSAVVRFTNLHNPYQIKNERKFKNMVKLAFNQRRKTLRNALSSMLNENLRKEKVFDKRAEQLSVQEFVDLFNMIDNEG